MYYMKWTEHNIDAYIIKHIATRPTFDINYQNGTYDALSWAARQKFPLAIYKTLIDSGADPKKKFENKNAFEWYVVSNAKSLDKEIVKYLLKQVGSECSALDVTQLKTVQAEITEVQ